MPTTAEEIAKLSNSLTFNGVHFQRDLMILNYIVLDSNIFAVFINEPEDENGRTFFHDLQDLYYGPEGDRNIDPVTGLLIPIEENYDDVQALLFNKSFDKENVVYMKRVSYKKPVEEVPYVAGEMQIGVNYDFKIFTSDLPQEDQDEENVNLFKYYKIANIDFINNPASLIEWFKTGGEEGRKIYMKFTLDYFGDQQVDGSQDYEYNLIQLVINPTLGSTLLTENRYNKNFLQNNDVNYGFSMHTIVQKSILREFEQMEEYALVLTVKI